MIVVHIPSWFPDAERPLNGNFIMRQIEAVSTRCDAILLRHTDNESGYTVPAGVHFHPIPSQPKRKLPGFYDAEFRKIIEEHGKPDIIHLHVALPLGPIAARLSRKYRIPLIVSEHWSVYQPMNRTALKLHQKWALRYVYKTASHITAVSRNLLDNIAATVPEAAGKPRTVVGNVVDTTLFALKDNSARDEKKRILHVSTLDNDAKNIMGILRAVDKLRQRRDDFELNIVHDFRNILAETFVRERGLESTVHFLGRKTSAEIADLLHHSDFFLLFSNYENQPCVLLEAFSTGTPAVTTPVGGIPEITGTDNAVLVTPRDETQLVEKLDFMLDNSRNYTPATIREQTLQRCSPQTISEKWMEIYLKHKR